MAQVDNLRKRFSEFRNASEVASETAYIETALQISRYVEKKNSIEEIKRDFLSGPASEQYQQFEVPHKKRSMGAILYGKLMIDDYKTLDSSAEENELLLALSGIVGSLYANPRSFNLKTLDDLCDKAKQWLNTYTKTTTHTDAAHKLSQSLYTMLTCLKLYMSELPGWQKRLVGADTLTKGALILTELLETVEQTAHNLEQQRTERAANEQDKVKSIQDYLTDRGLQILSHDSEDHIARLEALEAITKDHTADLMTLITKRKELEEIENTQKDLADLLKAANKNDTKTMGRKYFLDFVEANKTSFNLFLKVLTESQKQQFLQTLKPLSHPTASQSTAAAALGVMSWLISPAAVAARALSPQFIKDSLSALIPDTHDSYCKNQLKALLREHLSSLQNIIDVKRQEIKVLEAKLAGENKDMLYLIEHSDLHSLQDNLTAQTTTLELTKKYKEVFAPVQHLRKKLNSIEHLDKSIANFVRENDTFYKKVLDFFARFGQWFKLPSLSQKIAEAKEMKAELQGLREQHEQGLETQLTQFNLNPEVSEPIKVRLKQQLEPDLESQNHLANSGNRFNTLKYKMAELKHHEEEEEEEADSNMIGA